MPSSFVAEALADELTRAYPVFRKKILLVRGNLRRAVLQEKLTRAGAQVDEIEVYETKPLSTSRRSIQNALRGGVDYVTLTSSSVAQGFVQAAGKKVLKKKTGRPKIASIGPVTSQTLKSLGWKADLEAKTFTLDGLIETLLQDRRKKT
jgi:uroporphyrinogen III methyltransferase/synthase